MIHWELHTPAGLTAPGWLEEISELRGRVLYESGRRPGFRRTDGRFADPDPRDMHAYHILARLEAQLVGCVRLLIPVAHTPGVTEGLLGLERFMSMLKLLGATRNGSIEAGRWIADPAYRGSRVGVLLAAGAIATARSLSVKVLFCPVGTREKQDRVLARLGLKPVPHVPLIAMPAFDDEVRVMHIFPAQPLPHIAELMDAMATELRLWGKTTFVSGSPTAGVGKGIGEAPCTTLSFISSEVADIDPIGEDIEQLCGDRP